MQTSRARWVTPVTDYGPIVAFFVAYLAGGLMVATATLMAVTLVALVVAYTVNRRVPPIPLVTAIVVGLFGGLTLFLQDETFIKIKPTIVQSLFAVVLIGGLLAGRPLLKPLMGSAFKMSDTGWRQLTLRYALFFAAMAALNEAVWRTTSTDFWVSFKVFGILGLTMLFVLSQLPLMNRHQMDDDDEKGAEDAASPAGCRPRKIEESGR